MTSMDWFNSGKYLVIQPGAKWLVDHHVRLPHMACCDARNYNFNAVLLDGAEPLFM